MSCEEIHPLVYFWIAFYSRDDCLSQFDFDTGKENSFRDVDQTKLKKFGLYPFNAALAIKVNMVAGKIIARADHNLPYYTLRVEKGQKLVYFRRNFIHTYDFTHCKKCGFEWQYNPDRKSGELTEFGMEIYPTLKCPKCQNSDVIILGNTLRIIIYVIGYDNNLMFINEDGTFKL